MIRLEKITNIKLKLEMIIHFQKILFFLKINHSSWTELVQFLRTQERLDEMTHVSSNLTKVLDSNPCLCMR